MPLPPCNTKMQPPAIRGEFVFRICRQIAHYVSPFYAGPKENQHYGKLYVKDASVAVQQRIRNNKGFNANINP